MTLRATCVETATCCAWEAGYCMDNKWKIFGIDGTLANFVVDPDEIRARDPRPAGLDEGLPPRGCTMMISWGGEQLCTPVAAHATYSISVTDGAASATDSFLVTRTCAL